MIKEIMFHIDYYLMYFMYSDRKLYRYHEYMIKKYGSRYLNPKKK